MTRYRERREAGEFDPERREQADEPAETEQATEQATEPAPVERQEPAQEGGA